MHSTTNKPLTLLQFSDLHLFTQPDKRIHNIFPEQSFLQTFRQAITENPPVDLILLTGDLAEDPYQAVYQRLNQLLSPLQIPVVCLPGNHDDYQIMQNVFTQPPVTCNKLTRLGNWQIIALNSQIIGEKQGSIAPLEMEFLKDTLANSEEFFSVVAIHHHCIPTNSLWMDRMQLENSDVFLKMLTRYKRVKLVLSGHAHQPLNALISGITILGTPSTCYQFKPNSRNFAITNKPACYRWVSLSPNGDITSKIGTLRLTD